MTQENNSQIRETVSLMAKVGKCWSPTFSPDSQQIAFVSDLSGLPQVWRIAVDGGFPRRVTAIDEQVTQVQWSPDGAWLALEAAPGGGMNTQIYIVRPDGTDLRRLTSGGISNNWLGKWSDDSQYVVYSSNVSRADVMDSYRVAIETGEAQKVADNNGVGRIEDISADGSQLLINRVVYRGDTNIYLVDIDTGNETLLTDHEPPSIFSYARFADDGESVYMISNRDTDLATLVKIALNRDDDWTIVRAREDAELVEYTLSNSGDKVALIWNIAGRTELEFYNLAANETIATIELEGEIVTSLKFSKDDQSLVLNVTGSKLPPDIWIMDVTDHQQQQLTYSPHVGINLDNLVKPSLEVYPAHDGLELTGWLYRPQNLEPPYPIVLSFHGGPEGQEQPRFRADYQALTEQGIAVFAPNVRGSSGFGKRFVNLDNGALRVNAVRDIESTVNYLVDKNIARQGSIGIMGGSYGGYMTMAGLVEFPSLFAAGVNLYGVVNFKTFFEQTEPWMASISKIEYGDPDTEGDMLDALSPIFKLDNVTAPTLVLHGANDTNVPVYEAEQVVEQLKARNIPVEYILFPDEGHGFRKESNRVTATTATVEWFIQYLKAAPD